MFIGFDYGTANCSVAVMRENTPQLLTLENGSALLPSMLCAPTREAVSEWLYRHHDVPTHSDENQALLRRASATAEPSTLTVGDLSIDLLSRKVYRGSTRIDIQPLEFTLLEYLARNAGRVVSKTMIMEHVWEYNFDPQTNIVETRMCRLREKLDKPFKEKLLHTVRGFGYVLEPEADFRHR